ncbi:MAG: glycosyltransferase, partial [Acidobacteria bacterium]|nr:glycosyltransferase [Acidobacteriota bacterium]
EPPNTGLVTCLYRGRAAPTLASRLEALSISTDFAAGVFVAHAIERGLRFGLGSTLALRHEHLMAIGGFEAIADYLADDYEVGRRIRQHGLKVRLSSCVVDTFLPAYSFRQFFRHQLRWARTIRSSRPAGYTGLLLTYPLAWAGATVVAAGARSWSWAVLAIALLTRTAMAIRVAAAVEDEREVLRSLWLLPIRDFLAVFIWAAASIGRRIVWRGELFNLARGRLIKIR